MYSIYQKLKIFKINLSHVQDKFIICKEILCKAFSKPRMYIISKTPIEESVPIKQPLMAGRILPNAKLFLCKKS
jgi:hypothetical protein